MIADMSKMINASYKSSRLNIFWISVQKLNYVTIISNLPYNNK